MVSPENRKWLPPEGFEIEPEDVTDAMISAARKQNTVAVEAMEMLFRLSALTPEAISMQYGQLTLEAIAAHREAGRLVAQDYDETPYYPAWQFDATTPTGVRMVLPDVLTVAAMTGKSVEAFDAFMRIPRDELNDVPTIDALGAPEGSELFEASWKLLHDAAEPNRGL